MKVLMGFTNVSIEGTPKEGVVTDVEGNGYFTVKIGDQTWMAENLKTTRFNDRTRIPLVSDYNAWAALSTTGYCWYNNNKKNGITYGALYNWYTVSINKLCPIGWHVPTDEEWKTLIAYLGGESVAGGKLKEKGTVHWESPNTGATNESGFTAIPGGDRKHDGTFDENGSNVALYRSNGCWWSSSEQYAFNAHYLRLYSSLNNAYGSLSVKQSGYSVRCLKD